MDPEVGRKRRRKNLRIISTRIRKLSKDLRSKTFNPYEVALISDSKGYAFQKLMRKIPDLWFPVYCRSSVKCTNYYLQKLVRNKIEDRNKKPIIFYFFGTCELTVKEGKYIRIAHDPKSKVEEIINHYMA